MVKKYTLINVSLINQCLQYSVLHMSLHGLLSSVTYPIKYTHETLMLYSVPAAAMRGIASALNLSRMTHALAFGIA